MMRDTARLQRDIEFFIHGAAHAGFGGFGPDSIFWSDDGGYLFLPAFRLPDIYTQSHTPLLVLVPARYGRGEPFRDAFVDARLQTRNGRPPSRLLRSYMDHMLPKDPRGRKSWARLAEVVHYPGAIPPLSYLCLHSSADVCLWDYLEQLFTYLSRPQG